MSRSRRIRALVAALLGTALLAGSALAQEATEATGQWNFDDFEDADPTFLELAAAQAPDIALFTVFAVLVMVSFLRKSVPLKYLTLVFSVAYLGIYKNYLVSITNVLSSLTGTFPLHAEGIVLSSLAIFAVITTVLWGRVYCGRVCAFGALTQLIDAIVPKRFQIEIPPALERRAGLIKYGILFGAIGYYLVTHENAFYRYIEPFWMFSREATTLLWVGLGLLLVASIFVRNLYCRFLCPLGAALGLVSALSVFKIKRWSECSTCKLCENACEWGAIRNRKIIMPECVRCDDCEILYASKTKCPHWLLDAKRKRLGTS